MAVKGWVYIITNKAMPGLVKVGYTLKDPSLRATELANTGVPYPYEVKYEVLLIEPRSVEQAVHKELSTNHAGGEWFSCSISAAIQVIRDISGFNRIVENVLTDENVPISQPWLDPLRVKLAEEPTRKPERYVEDCQASLDVDAIRQREFREKEERAKQLAEAEIVKSKFRIRRNQLR